MRIGFLLIPGFALMSYASAVEPLRAANTLSGRRLYDWVHISPGEPDVQASCGASVPCPMRVGDNVRLDILFVCAGGNPASFSDKPTFAWLRRLAKQGIRMGGVSGGPYVLARAGLMSGRHMTIHWEHASALQEELPDLMLSRSLYVVDRDRLTCAGGVAAIDMMHRLIAHDHGSELATQVSDWFLHTEIRPAGGPQRASLSERYGIHRRELIAALELMENNLSEPLDRKQVAQRIGLSTRQLDRLFANGMNRSFAEHYRSIRLDRARDLIRQTPLSITEISVACGFANTSHLSRAYAARFGHPPRVERQKTHAE